MSATDDLVLKGGVPGWASDVYVVSSLKVVADAPSVKLNNEHGALGVGVKSGNVESALVEVHGAIEASDGEARVREGVTVGVHFANEVAEDESFIALRLNLHHSEDRLELSATVIPVDAAFVLTVRFLLSKAIDIGLRVAANLTNAKEEFESLNSIVVIGALHLGEPIGHLRVNVRVKMKFVVIMEGSFMNLNVARRELEISIVLADIFFSAAEDEVFRYGMLMILAMFLRDADPSEGVNEVGHLVHDGSSGESPA